jgi:hypothetical protein
MCCLAAVMALIGPRFAIFLWWLFDMDRWGRSFDSFFVGIVGFMFVPWTTIGWVIVAPDGVRGFDWVVLALGFLFDVGSYSGGGYSGRSRYFERVDAPRM